MEVHLIEDKTLIRIARLVSAIFTPFSIPFLAFLILFLFSYLSIMPIQYKLIVLGIVYCFTIMMPVLTIFIFKKINGFSAQELGERKKRYVPFFLTIISYVFCLMMMNRLNIPWYMSGIILAALIMMVICVVVNLKWKLSEHMAGAVPWWADWWPSVPCSATTPCGGSASSSWWPACWARPASSWGIIPWAKSWEASVWASSVR